MNINEKVFRILALLPLITLLTTVLIGRGKEGFWKEWWQINSAIFLLVLLGFAIILVFRLATWGIVGLL